MPMADLYAFILLHRLVREGTLLSGTPLKTLPEHFGTRALIKFCRNTDKLVTKYRRLRQGANAPANLLESHRMMSRQPSLSMVLFPQPFSLDLSSHTKNPHLTTPSLPGGGPVGGE
jgi:hypothetical protein